MVSSYGPPEATTADVVAAVADAELITRQGGNYAAAWEAAQATSDNQWRAVVRQAQSREPEPEAALPQTQARGHTLRAATPHVAQAGQPEPGPPEPEAHL